MKKILVTLTLIVSSLSQTAFGAMVALPENSLSSTAAPSYIAIDTATSMTAIPTFNATKEATVDARLQAIAEISGFGYKTANLMELTELMHDPELQATLSSHGCSVTVPAFHGIASPAIVAHLEANGFNLARTWAGIVETVTPEVSVKAFATKQLPATFARDITTLGAQLKTFFDKQAAAVEPCGFLRSCLHRFFSQASFIDELTPFLEATSKAGQTLIVRSTGMEDKKGLANAGGNESIKHVAPTMPAVLRAVGQVIESYFSEKSFSQRLLAGDKTIFELPATPVLVQVMVSKPASGKRPIECVIHTTDQAGPTPGLASFNCGYNVVASSQRADQCYHFHTGGGHCILARGVEHVPATVRLALTAVSSHIEHHYQRATDIELLVDTAAGIISMVQARPLNRPATLASPSYVADLAAVTAENIAAAQTVVAAGSSVRHVTAQNHLIVAPTLKTAETIFLYHTSDKAAVLAIVVQGEAEPNSHEATTFATEGKLVMVAHDYEKITAWHAMPSLNLYLDPQQGVIINSGTTAITIASGYTTHPMPAHISIEAPATAATLPFAIADYLPAIETPALVILLKQGPVLEAQQALASLIARINHQVETVQHDIVCTAAPALCADAQAKLIALERFARQKAVTMLPLLARERNDLSRLAAVKPVETLLVQEEDPMLVDTYSVASVLKEFTKRKTFVEQQASHVSSALFSNLNFLDMACAGHHVAMTPELETKWLTFVGFAAATPTTQQQLTEIWQTLEQFKLTSLWINTLFNAAAGDAATMLTQLHGDVAAAHAALAHLDTLRQDIGKLPPVAWSQPEKFESNLTTLRGLVARFTSPEFISSLTGDNKLVIAATLSTMDSFVDTFDRSIKALKASSIDNKVVHFKELLGIYYELLYAWAPTAQTHITFYPAWPLTKYLGQIETILAALPSDEGQLLPSLAFSVSAAMLGSATVFEWHLPQTAEDVFTLIHQNLLVVTGALTNHHFAPLIAKPKLFSNLETVLFQLPYMEPSSYTQLFPMQLISINCIGTSLQAHYNLPIRHHSAAFDIICDKITNTTQLITHFVGQRFIRWDIIEAHALLNKDSNLVPSNTHLGAQEVSITYNFQPDQNLEPLASTLSLFVEMANAQKDFVQPANSDPAQLFMQLYKNSPSNSMLSTFINDLIPLSNRVATTQEIDKAMPIAAMAIASNNPMLQKPAINFFEWLVQNNYTAAFEAVTSAATTYITNDITNPADDWYWSRLRLINMFGNLFHHKYAPAFVAATTIVTTGITSSNKYRQKLALNFFNLVLLMASHDKSTRAIASNVFDSLGQHMTDHMNLSRLTIADKTIGIGGMAKPTHQWQIQVLQQQDVKLIVSLTEDPLSPELFEGTTVKNIHLPIASGSIPTPDQVARFLDEAQQVITSGGKVIVHCEAGQNRTGTMLALWLMAHEHMTADQAIELVRTQRPGSISSSAQEEFLRTWKK